MTTAGLRYLGEVTRLRQEVAEAVEMMVARGGVPDVFASSNLVGRDEANRALLDTYAPRVRAV